ncbi:MAG: beta-phosphoglucomutase [Bacteroidetes bacterium]|jgi:beta-phosphoglucomutase|nr:beta-phosphoglucomutase [Bacteroidota bacterium]
MVEIKGLIFDLDGVIVETSQFHFLAWQKLARSIGGDLSPQQNKKLKGVGRMESLDKILLWNSIGLTENQKETLASKKNQWYQEMISSLSPKDALPGARTFVEQAKAKKFQIALGSSSKNARPVLEALEMTSLFDVIIDGTQTTKTKPDPQVFTMGARKLKLTPDSIIVFEDAIRGVEASRSGGFWAVGVGDKRDFPMAHHVIPNLENCQINSIIEELETK